MTTLETITAVTSTPVTSLMTIAVYAIVFVVGSAVGGFALAAAKDAVKWLTSRK